MKLCAYRLCRKQIIVSFFGDDNNEYCGGQCWREQLKEMERTEIWIKTHKNSPTANIAGASASQSSNATSQ